MVVRRSGMQAVSVTPVRGKNCFLVKSLMCCSIRNGYGCDELGSVYHGCSLLKVEQIMCHDYILEYFIYLF